ncbi:MAG: hypothetical protein WCB68_09335 [Pyrinomonadaceae bacterium]
MIAEQHKKKAGSAGDCFDYLITDRLMEQARASRVADIAVYNLPVMPRVPETRGEASELVRTLTRSMNSFTRNARLSAVRTLENELLHVVLSFHPEDTAKLRNICGGPVAVALEVAKKVAGTDRAMALILHDARHLHAHTIISSPDTQGRAWDSSFDRYRWNMGAREIELKYNLSALQFDTERHSLSPTEHRRLERCGIPDLLDRMRATICAARSDSPSRELFEQRLENVGITVSERYDSERKVRGWVFNHGDVSIKGSAIHRGLSYRNVKAGLNPERVTPDPGREQDVLNVMTLTMADEEIRQEFMRHPRAGIRYLGHMAEELRTGKVGRTWEDLGTAAEQRLAVRAQLVPVKPRLVRLEHPEPVPLSKQHAKDRNDFGVTGRPTSPSHDGGGGGRSR